MNLERPSPCDKASWHAGVGTVRTPPRPRPHLTRRNSKPSWLALFRTLLQGANHWDFLPFKLLYNRAVGGALLSSASRFGAAPGEALLSVTFVLGKGHRHRPSRGAKGSLPHLQFGRHNSAGGEVKTLAAP